MFQKTEAGQIELLKLFFSYLKTVSKSKQLFAASSPNKLDSSGLDLD